MKTLYTLLAACLISGSLFSQGNTSVEIISDADGLDYAGEAITVTGSGYQIYEEFHVKNTGTTNTFYYSRKIVSKSYEGFQIQLCDDITCYGTGDGPSWISPEKTIEPGELSIFKPQISTSGVAGTAEVVYYVLDEFENKVDSLTVHYSSTAAIEKQNKTTFKLFPNPAQDVITITSEATANGATVVFIDPLGKEVKKSFIKGINSKVNISDLKRGVYFVNIYGNDGQKSVTQRLIKQ